MPTRISDRSDGRSNLGGDGRDPAGLLADRNLTIDATDQEIEVAARHLDPEAPQDAIEAIRVVIEAVRAVGHP